MKAAILLVSKSFRIVSGLVTGKHPVHAFHAISSTEKRYLFRPLLWNEAEKHDEHQHVQQVTSFFIHHWLDVALGL